MPVVHFGRLATRKQWTKLWETGHETALEISIQIDLIEWFEYSDYGKSKSEKWSEMNMFIIYMYLEY